MVTYILRRLMLMVPTLLGVTAVVFFIMALAPGGFGGMHLGAEGAQSEGDEARRVREYFDKRYGLDKPVVVQYARWLNQVSPMGFRTSSTVTFRQAELDQSRQMVVQDETIARLRMVRAMQNAAVNLAAWHDADLIDTTQKLLAIAEDPRLGLAVLHELNPPDEDPDPLAQRVAEQLASDPDQARREVLREIAYEVSLQERIHFHRFGFKWPDFGMSLRGRRVTDLLGEAVPITLLLNLITIPIIYLIAIPVGIFAARHRGKFVDVGSGAAMLALWSVPTIWVGVMLIGFLANVQFVRWFPTGGLHSMEAATMTFLPRFTEAGFERGWLLDFAWHLVLPVVCLTYGGFAVLTKLTRGAILDNISADYVRTARAKGVDEHTVLFRHVFRNSLLPLITVAAGIFPALFAGAVVVENIFSIPGMGRLGVEAAFMKDREVVMGTTLLGGLIGLSAELLRDIWYAVADPRVTYE